MTIENTPEEIIDNAIAIPTLTSLNLKETKDFYMDMLGFSDMYEDGDNYLIIKRDNLEIHFTVTDNPKFPKNSTCYIRGGQIKDLFAEYQQKAVPNLSNFEIREWNMREFYIIDPHGNLLRFGMTPD